MATTQPKKIRLGICMAGAVSAGAYTAGVIDYLIETLERWQLMKDSIRKKIAVNALLTAEEELVPLHDVVIEVLSGASAGGMTAAVLAYSFNDDTYITRRNNEMIHKNYNCPLDNDIPTKLYRSWIDMVDDKQGTTFSKLMDTSDVTVSLNNMPSLLNSAPIDQIAAKAVPEKIHFQPPAYISNNLSVVLSVTNVEGVPVDIRFSNIDETNPTRNVLWMHSGYLHYQYNEHKYNLDFPPEIISEQFKDHLASAAKATGAFPFGLTNRRMFVTPPLFEEFKNRMKANYNMEINAKLKPGANYIFTAVDGGAINNEPVGTTEKILHSKKEHHHPDDEHFVILIDPFPTVTNAGKEYSYEEPERYTLTKQAMKLLSAFMHQSSFKQEDLLHGLKMMDNKFLIYPAKRRHYYLACGEVGGFSGFLKKEFRQHDYQLGRKNCQSFLRYYFGVSIEKLETITGSQLSQKQKDKWAYDINFGKENKPVVLRFPLVPDMLMLDAKDEEILGPEYNGLSTDEMKVITTFIDQRISKITEATYPSLTNAGKGISSIIGGVMKMWPVKGFLKKKIRGALSQKVNSYLNDIFMPQLVKQEILVTKIADIIERNGRTYKKVKGVTARVAEGGEKITTITNGKIETVNVASRGDYIVKNDTTAGEEFIVKPNVFHQRYTQSHDNYFMPTDNAKVYALQLTANNIYDHSLTGFQQLATEPDKPAHIEPPWKESQTVKLDDWLVCFTTKNEVYCIDKTSFAETYKESL